MNAPRSELPLLVIDKKNGGQADWGAMERKGLSRPGGTAPAGTQSPAQLGR